MNASSTVTFDRIGSDLRCRDFAVTPDPMLSTYMVGHSIWELMRKMETGIERARVP